MSAERRVIAVDYFADLACPWCYVGWVALKRAAHQRRETIVLELRWHSLLLWPNTPKEGMDREAFMSTRVNPVRQRAGEQALLAAGQVAGAPFNEKMPARPPNTLDAHRMVHWASQQGAAEALIDQIYRAYWVDGGDIGKSEVLLAAAKAAGLDPKPFAKKLASDADRQTVRDIHAASTRIAASGAPVTVFNRRKRLIGAQQVDAVGYTLDALAAS